MYLTCASVTTHILTDNCILIYIILYATINAYTFSIYFHLLCIYQCTHVTQPLYITYSMNHHTISLLIHALTYLTHTVFKHHAPIPYNTLIQSDTFLLAMYISIDVYIHHTYTIYHTSHNTFI